MLQIKNIFKQYKTGNLVQKALDDVSLNLRDNEFVAILGPSGSGKTTLLNIIGGLDCYDDGDLIINDISTKNYKDKDWDSYRNHTIGFVFQSYNLIPHQTILSNVELALTISGVSIRERKKRALEALKQVGLDAHAHKKPNQLSGGQMQRVAIARALVNNPDILLADEPTGALDTDTSVQVMELLKEVAKDRLVVMVTHNPELAEKYATRIVNLRDGKIRSDSDPYVIEENGKEAEHKNMGKTSMSFLTSLLLSFNNLKTKKGRTLLTAFAGSIGIIGIALILSLSTGVNNYIHSIEEDTLSEYPLQIQKTGINMSSMFANSSKDIEDSDIEGDIHINPTLSSIFSSVGTNDLASLKKYFESDECNINDYAKTIDYIYDITPQIYSSKTDKIRKLNPNTAFGDGTQITSTNSMMLSMMNSNVFARLPKEEELYINQYDIKAGRMPEKYNECVLVLTENGNISDFFLYVLGFRDFDELDKMVEQFSKEETVNVANFDVAYAFNDMLKVKFKIVNAFDFYEYDEEYDVWVNKADNEDFMRNVINNSEDLKIVGVIQPKEGVTAAMLNSGIYYTTDLTNHLVANAKNSEVVKKQLESPDINIFTGKRFDEKENNDEEDEDGFNMSSLMEVDANAMQSAFNFDESKINVDFSDLNESFAAEDLPEIDIAEILSQIDFHLSVRDIQILMADVMKGYDEYVKTHPTADLNQLLDQLSDYLDSNDIKELLREEIEKAIEENGSIALTEEQMKEILSKILKDYEDYVKENDLIDISQFENYVLEYIKSDELKDIVGNNISRIIESQHLDKQIAGIMEMYMGSIMGSMGEGLEEKMMELTQSMGEAMSFNPDVFASAIHMKMDEDDFSELFSTLMSKEKTTYENNLKKLSYVDYDNPDGINIFPKDFESNKAIIKLLNDYNTRMSDEGKEDKVISFTDLVGTLMSSVTTIVDVISYVLVAFVAISLVVSSIMIGVITYISVLERRKEIGILRAIGASKRNISQVFNAETFIIGLLAGVLGIGITLLILIPANKIIAFVSKGAAVTAKLPLLPALILILLSTILTLIGGILPSKKAAKEDPVLALRSE